MATTMLTFLYQTRTIQRLARSTPAHLGSYSLVHNTSAHNFSSSSSNRRFPRNKEPSFNTEDPIPFELPEDLAADPRFNPPPENEYEEASESGTITPKERQAFDGIFKEIARTSEIPKYDMMITAKDISSQSTYYGSNVDTSNKPSRSLRREQSIITSIIEDASRDFLSSKKSPHQYLLNSMRQLHNIDPLGREASSDMTVQERYERLLSFPPSLRSAAKRALGILKPGEKDQSVDLTPESPIKRHPEHMPLDRKEYLAGQIDQSIMESEPDQTEEVDLEWPQETWLPPAPEASSVESGPSSTRRADRLTLTIEAEKSRYQERLRFDALISQTKSDFELWDLLEREVFSMVSRLGLDAAAKPKPRRAKKPKKTSDASTASVAIDSEPQPQLDLLVHGPLYSSHIVSGLMAMDQRYPGSPLALSILPRVKSLGLASYILGASVDLYTAQMMLHWNRYRDVRAVLDLMDEMRSAELTFDQKHQRLVERMQNAMLQCISGKRGDALANIIAAPEWATLLATRIAHFKKWISTELQNREELAERTVELDEEMPNLEYDL